jgi:hypothetical protein
MPFIELDSISKAYDGKPVLRGVSLAAEAESITLRLRQDNPAADRRRPRAGRRRRGSG